MEEFYWVIFAVLAVIVAGLVLTQAQSNVVPSSGPLVASFLRLRNSYVFVYALMMGERAWFSCRGYEVWMIQSKDQFMAYLDCAQLLQLHKVAKTAMS